MGEGKAGASQPVVALVSGPRRTGKTTLARKLAASLGLPLTVKDTIKEVLFGPGRDRSRIVQAAGWGQHGGAPYLCRSATPGTGITCPEICASTRPGVERKRRGTRVRRWAEACVACGECEPKCPQEIPIRERLLETAAALGIG